MRESSSNNFETSNAARSSSNENTNKIFIQDSKLNNGLEEFDKKEESEMQQQDFSDDNKPKMTKEEVESLIDNKRSELDIKIYDLVTRHQVEEKKIEDTINNETDEEERSRLVLILEETIKNNENNIALLKE